MDKNKFRPTIYASINEAHMTMKYIRDAYGVPAKRGGRVEYTDDKGEKFYGTIVSAKLGYLRVKLDVLSNIDLFHPTWNIKYIPPVK